MRKHYKTILEVCYSFSHRIERTDRCLFPCIFLWLLIIGYLLEIHWISHRIFFIGDITGLSNGLGLGFGFRGGLGRVSFGRIFRGLTKMDVKRGLTDFGLGLRVKEISKIEIHSLIFNIEKEIFIEKPELNNIGDFERVYDSILKIINDVDSIEYKGFINSNDLKRLTVINKFLDTFTNDSRFIMGDKSSKSYK